MKDVQNHNVLKNIFLNVASQYSHDTALAATFWSGISSLYQGENRHYHNLHHISNFYTQSLFIEDQITNWDNFVLALLYHDVIYDYSKSDNEAQSAAFARQQLEQLHFPENDLKEIEALILATQSHQAGGNADICLFVDCDLSILGAEHKKYLAYAQNIRKEYALIPDTIYHQGRANVLQSFLKRDAIFNTSYFNQKLEKQARQNLASELEMLKK